MIKVRLAAYTCAALMLGVAGQAYAQSASQVCKSPVAPDEPVVDTALVRPTPPERPVCDQNHTCRTADVNRYNDAIGKFNAAQEDYIKAKNKQTDVINNYIKKMNVYTAEVDSYVGCERRKFIDAADAN